MEEGTEHIIVAKGGSFFEAPQETKVLAVHPFSK